jgi:formylglycine-generating enzyme required for sulfatase activity/proteasome lid subunit RPN8/RPN11
MPDQIAFPVPMYERLLSEVAKRHPVKTFGYLLSDGNPNEPTDFVLFEENIRNSDGWRHAFHAYGHYFIEHQDAGFVATPEESWRVQKEIWARGLREVGVLHSHQRHPANFSGIDWDMHRQRFCNLWHVIISMRNPWLPQVRAFAISDAGVRLLALQVNGQHGTSPRLGTASRDLAIERVRRLTRPDSAGLPALAHADAIVAAIHALRGLAQEDVIAEVLSDGILRDSAQRFEEHIAPLTEPIKGAHFAMGTDQADVRHFYGESPRHACQLSAFQMMRVQVTAELFSLIDPSEHKPSRSDRKKPVVNVTWAEAVLFALWMGCRLPTEAEWEYCCGTDSSAQWCCNSEQQLRRYAWYSANARDRMHIVATREPNALGLFDMHGNAWEWCQDDYDQYFYRQAPLVNPVNLSDAGHDVAAPGEKVVRGGSMNALAEMCRTRYRFHEAAKFWAGDLGFRLARGGT